MARWEVKNFPEVDKLIANMTPLEKEKTIAAIGMLREYGPYLEMRTRGQYAHSLKNSRHANLKELIVKAGKSVWRFAYYVDKNGIAYILCGGDKRGMSESLFYRRLIDKADRRIDAIERGQYETDDI